MLKLNKTSTVEIHWSYHSSSLHHFVNGEPDGELKFPVTELHVHCIHVCDDWKLKCYKRFLYLLAGSSVYLVQFVLGYILMLAVMTYNANIFLAVIFGQSTHSCRQHRTYSILSTCLFSFFKDHWSATSCLVLFVTTSFWRHNSGFVLRQSNNRRMLRLLLQEETVPHKLFPALTRCCRDARRYFAT